MGDEQEISPTHPYSHTPTLRGIMYCPNCGWNNQQGVKFCTRCGTNLGAVSDALTGKLGEASQIDERMIKLLKDYNKGRRDAVTGAVLIPAGGVIMTILILAGLSPVASFFIICWMFFWGIAALADGLGKYMAAGSEMKALNQIRSQGALNASREQLALMDETPTPRYATDPINTPASVTEQTTRHLEDHPYRVEKKESQ